MREISLMMTRMYWQRCGTSMPHSLSTARMKPTLLISGET